MLSAVLSAVLSATVLAAAILYAFPPEHYGFYPRCPIYEFTGLLCPGCGATRALAALLHGHFAEAMHWNGLIVLLLPVLPEWGLAAYARAIAGDAPAWPKVHPYAVGALCLVAAAFAVVRNIV